MIDDTFTRKTPKKKKHLTKCIMKVKYQERNNHGKEGI